MKRENRKLGRELERIRKRLQAGKKTLHDTQMRAENLDTTIQTVIRDQQAWKRKNIS